MNQERRHSRRSDHVEEDLLEVSIRDLDENQAKAYYNALKRAVDTSVTASLVFCNFKEKYVLFKNYPHNLSTLVTKDNKSAFFTEVGKGKFKFTELAKHVVAGVLNLFHKLWSNVGVRTWISEDPRNILFTGIDEISLCNPRMLLKQTKGNMRGKNEVELASVLIKNWLGALQLLHHLSDTENEFITLLSVSSYRQNLSHPALWHPGDGWRYLYELEIENTRLRLSQRRSNYKGKNWVPEALLNVRAKGTYTDWQNKIKTDPELLYALQTDETQYSNNNFRAVCHFMRNTIMHAYGGVKTTTPRRVNPTGQGGNLVGLDVPAFEAKFLRIFPALFTDLYRGMKNEFTFVTYLQDNTLEKEK